MGVSPKINPICALLDLARIICPAITLSFHIFPVYRVEKVRHSRYLGLSNPISRNFKTQFPDIPSQKVANPASRKSPARPRKLASVKIIIMEVVSTGHSSSHGDISSVDIIIQTNNPRPKKRKTVQTTYRILVDLGEESINYISLLDL